jgi:hypothetical protein
MYICRGHSGLQEIDKSLYSSSFTSQLIPEALGSLEIIDHHYLIMNDSEKPHIIHEETEPSEKQVVSSNASETDLTTLLKAHPVETWSRGSLHLYAVCLLVYLCSTMNGIS